MSRPIPQCIIWKFQAYSVSDSIYNDFDRVFLEIPEKNYIVGILLTCLISLWFGSSSSFGHLFLKCVRFVKANTIVIFSLIGGKLNELHRYKVLWKFCVSAEWLLSTLFQWGTLSKLPQCNFSLEFPEILRQYHIHVCYHWLSVYGNSKIILTNMPYWQKVSQYIQSRLLNDSV